MKFKKFLIRAFFPVAKLYWFIFRPETYGVKVMIVNGDEVLLIRNSYGHRKWNLPGGGIKKGESADNAAKREVFEEVGIILQEIKKVGSYLNTVEYKKDDVLCFTAAVAAKDFKIDQQEIEEGRWFKFAELPENRALSVDRVAGMIK